jgi:hypothetical protein
VLLVRDGSYGSGALIDGKALLIVVEPGASATLTNPLRIRNTDAQSTVVARGFTVLSLISGCLEVDATDGAVLLEDCTLGKGIASPFGAVNAAEVTDAAGEGLVLFPPSDLVEIPGTARAAEITPFVSEGDTITPRLAGAPDDFAIFVWSLGALPGKFVSAYNGFSFLDPPLHLVFAGALPASVETTFSLPVPPTGLGNLAVPIHAIGLIRTRAGVNYVASPTVTVIAGPTAVL